MRIRRIELDGFGRLVDFSEEPAAGLHVFSGPNEAGKSTLQHAILALLYGFYQADHARPHEGAAKGRHEPWSGAPYRGRMEYELADGRRFRIDRDFSTTDVVTQVHDLSAGGRDVTDEYGRGRHGNLDLAMKHLGMPKAVFEACAFVSQGELFEIQEQAATIGDTIISLADSARRDVSARDALARLEKVYREDVGSPRARTTPLPVAQQLVERLKDELAQIDQVRAQMAEDAAERGEAQLGADQLAGELLRTRYLLLAARMEDTRQTIAQLDGLTRRQEDARAAMAEHEAYARFAVDERDAVQAEWARILETEERLAREHESAEGQRSRIETLAAQREEAGREQNELTHLRDFPAERRSVVDRLVADWRVAHTQAMDARAAVEAVDDSGDTLAEYESLEARVGLLTEAEIRNLYERLSARPRGGLVAAIGRFFGAIVRLILRLFGGKQASDLGGATVAVSREDAERLLADRERWNQLRPEVERRRSAHGGVASAEVALRRAEDAVREALRGAVDDETDLERAYQTFVQRCAGAARLQQIQDQLGAIDREIDTLSVAVRGFDRDGRQTHGRRAALDTRLRDLTRHAGSLEELLAAFDDACTRRRGYDRAARDLREAEEQRRILLGGRSPEELRRSLEESARETAGILAKDPALEGATTHEPPHELSQRTERIEADLHATELRITQLMTRIDAKLDELRPRAEVEEEIERARREVARLEGFRDELDIAKQLIDEAAEEAHRDFAPHVGRFLSARMAQVTAGRYRDLHLDPVTLEVRVESPETRRLEEIEKLSRGTRAVAYLLLRIGLAQHMSSMHEPVPLILDDPLVDLDDVRMEQFLELLLQLAADVQVLLFTKNEAIRTWFERHGDKGTPLGVTLLEGPEARTATRSEPQSIPEMLHARPPSIGEDIN